MDRFLRNTRILGQGGHMAVHRGIIPGWPGFLGTPGYLDKWGGGHMAVHPGIIPGWTCYLGISGYLDKGGIWLSILG